MSDATDPAQQYAFAKLAMRNKGFQQALAPQFGGMGGLNQWINAQDPSTGGTIGATIGYNWQAQGFVFGLEADGNWVGAKETKRQAPASIVDYTSKLEWLATVRARAGAIRNDH